MTRIRLCVESWTLFYPERSNLQMHENHTTPESFQAQIRSVAVYSCQSVAAKFTAGQAYYLQIEVMASTGGYTPALDCSGISAYPIQLASTEVITQVPVTGSTIIRSAPIIYPGSGNCGITIYANSPTSPATSTFTFGRVEVRQALTP